MSECKHNFDLAGDCRICGVTVEQLQNAELTRLRAENDRLTLNLATQEAHWKEDLEQARSVRTFTEQQVKALRAENEELRKALEALLRNLPYCHRCRNDDRPIDERGCSFCDAKSRAAELLNRKTP